MRRLSLALLSLLAACGSDASDTEAAPETRPSATTVSAAPPAVRIVAPAEGAEVTGPNVTVELEATGIEIVPAGETASGTGHHHLYLDADLAPMDEPVPSVPGQIIHMGDGSSAFTFEGVEPGEHRVIAVIGDGVHVPLQPPVVDTVHFVVR
jgi:ABC-type Fe3+-hydroxamate transport system substrate-binding protein